MMIVLVAAIANLGPFETTSQAQAAGGLVAALALDEGSGTTAADASGNGNVGAIGSATWTTQGKFGGALTFNY